MSRIPEYKDIGETKSIVIPEGSVRVRDEKIFCGAVDYVIIRPDKNSAGERYYGYDGSFYDEAGFALQKEAIFQIEMGRQIVQFLTEKDLLLFVSKETKTLRGQEKEIFRLAIYKRSSYPNSGALWDTGDFFANISDWQIEYPIFDKNGDELTPKDELDFVIHWCDMDIQVNKTFSVREKILKETVKSAKTRGEGSSGIYKGGTSIISNRPQSWEPVAESYPFVL